MMTPKERCENDPLFRALVHNFMHMFESQCGTGAGITPSEIREAAGFAWQIYMERSAFPPMVVRTPE